VHQVNIGCYYGKSMAEKQQNHGEEANRTYTILWAILYRERPQAELLAKEVPLKWKKKCWR